MCDCVDVLTRVLVRVVAGVEVAARVRLEVIGSVTVFKGVVGVIRSVRVSVGLCVAVLVCVEVGGML